MNRKKNLLPIVPLLFASCTAMGQTNTGSGAGLDHLNEESVMEYLASNNLETLLNRDFTNFNIPESERDQKRALIELGQLNDFRGTIAARRALALKVAKGLDALLPKATNPDTVLQQAFDLTQAGITPTVTAMEYFGENPVNQADLKPVAETAKKLYEKVMVLDQAKLDAMLAGIKDMAQFNAVQPVMNKLRNQKLIAEFSDNLQASYALCISLAKNDPQRKKLAEDTIKYLRDFDTPQSGLQPGVRVQIGKLQLLEGDPAAAKATFDSLLDPKNPTTPPPSVQNQNDARYFGIVALIQSKKLNDAEKAIPDLENWQTATYMPTLRSTSDQNSVKASLSMLKFRLYSAQSDLANIDADKKEKNDKAIDVLAELIKSQDSRDLKDLVFDQLIDRIPAEPDYKTLNPLILIALEEQGISEVVKPDDAPVDEKKLNRAIDAARELVSRKGQPGVDAAAASRAAQFIAYAYDRLKEGKQAATAFMDFAASDQTDMAKANDAMHKAARWVFKLHKSDPEGSRDLYDRFLPMAINPPFNRREFAFGYGALLFSTNDYKNAAENFAKVPKTSKNYNDAQKMQLLALDLQLTDSNMTAADKEKNANEIIELARNIDSLLTNATTTDDKAKYADWVVLADGVAADVARSVLKKPDESLEILTGYENRIAGAKDPQSAHINALKLRVSDYLDLKKVDDAVNTVVALLKENPEKGQDLMFDVLKTVEHEKDIATELVAKRDLAAAKATLSDFVVEWATKKNDSQLATYQLYAADAKREAAELAQDPRVKQAGLQEALRDYTLLNSRKPNDAYTLGIGLTQYDLGNYKEAMKALGSLVTGNKVGQPMMTMNVGGVEKQVDNPQYWECNYKDCRSVVEVYKQNRNDPTAQQDLKLTGQWVGALFISNGSHTGGTTYHDDFIALKNEIAELEGGTKPAK
jgi:hypothetical protein